ncbi:MAG: putative N-acetyltransferase YhbS [Algoriphagus sp.]|jgi:predicted N-acetyltransferase YhbS
MGLKLHYQNISIMAIDYKVNISISTEEICRIYESSGINRPTNDKVRIQKMYAQSNLVISAWDKGTLVGISRSLTDFAYCCYLSDLAVRRDYQKQGIGQALVAETRKIIGENVNLILLAAPSAVDYYPKIGFSKMNTAFIIKKKG